MVTVDLLRKSEHLADRKRRVEIIIHCCVEVTQERLSLHRQLCRRVRCPLVL